MAIEDFRHSTPLRVRWAEVDAQSIVFNGHYLLYADVCITEYWRSIGVRYPVDVVDTFGVDFYVVKSTLEYHASARFDDKLDLRCRVARLGRSSMRFIIEMYRTEGDENTHLVTGEVIYVCARPAKDGATQTSAPIPDTLRDRILNFEVLKPEV
ncbi:acyl-CoA thioesterase [Ralstonia insidiosa]|jgi:acyl-CoA thioester hydrolase|uniref:MFS transporter n=1 Tax=Ralstonia insidiosa TaxID=190721 RepID=A0A191ZW97_9RALS|nr:thioesterase family protein [Ralstonia insidiosa]ANJ72358.1 MFS transporter [Ralstonia insidiosa]KAB0472905.1 acyl-CoA thioesterase [Ralstonia insidiosa]MBY4907468.1 acyl-CoA thioesterase [Ralstonia insidiosa]